MAGSTSRPWTKDFAVPVAAHSPIAVMSSTVTMRRHHDPSVEIRNEKPAPPSAQVRYQGPSKAAGVDRKSTRLNSSHVAISYAVFCLKKKTQRGFIVRP